MSIISRKADWKNKPLFLKKKKKTHTHTHMRWEKRKENLPTLTPSACSSLLKIGIDPPSRVNIGLTPQTYFCYNQFSSIFFVRNLFKSLRCGCKISISFQISKPPSSLAENLKRFLEKRKKTNRLTNLQRQLVWRIQSRKLVLRKRLENKIKEAGWEVRGRKCSLPQTL